MPNLDILRTPNGPDTAFYEVFSNHHQYHNSYVSFAVNRCNENPRVGNTGLNLKFDCDRVNEVCTFITDEVDGSE